MHRGPGKRHRTPDPDLEVAGSNPVRGKILLRFSHSFTEYRSGIKEAVIERDDKN